MGIKERVGRRVRARRSERNLTRQELADGASLSLRFVAQLEKGDANISIEKLERVAHALHVPIEQLVAEEHRREVIALLGLRGAGKSTLGQRAAQEMDLPFVELDARIEEAAGLSLNEVFSLHGEAYYRRLEGQCVADLIATGGACVVALSGGIVHNGAAFDLVRQHTTTVWLKADPEDHMGRVLAQGDRRPMAQSRDAMAELRGILATREPLYQQADVTVDTSTQSEAKTLALLTDQLRG